MTRTSLTLLLVAWGAPPALAAGDGAVPGPWNDPSYRTPLLTGPATVTTSGTLERFFANEMVFQIASAFPPEEAAPTWSLGSPAIDAIAAAGPPAVERAATTETDTGVEAGSSLETPWDAWEHRESAVTEEYLDLDR